MSFNGDKLASRQETPCRYEPRQSYSSYGSNSGLYNVHDADWQCMLYLVQFCILSFIVSETVLFIAVASILTSQQAEKTYFSISESIMLASDHTQDRKQEILDFKSRLTVKDPKTSMKQATSELVTDSSPKRRNILQNRDTDWQCMLFFVFVSETVLFIAIFGFAFKNWAERQWQLQKFIVNKFCIAGVV